MDSTGPYVFDTFPDRRGTASIKWDHGSRFVGRDDLLPMWLADMDFRVAPEIQTAIERRLQHGVFGYTLEPESYFDAVRLWLERRHGAHTERAWIRPSPGVLASLTAAIHALTSPGDTVVIQPPVYFPFPQRIRESGRLVAENPLLRNGLGYEMDLDGLEDLLDRGARMLILCSPHNPVSRVWPRSVVAQAIGLCARKGVIVVSDEIHGDLVQPEHPHTPAYAAALDDARGVTVTLMSATKTFNLAGLGGALSIVPDAGLRKKLESVEHAWFPGIANAIAAAATEAAWRAGGPWLDALLRYVRGNYGVLREELSRRLPEATVAPLEGTYLAWIHPASGLTDEEVIRRLRGPHGVWLDEGRKFGTGGQGFQRMNLACPRPHVVDAVERMERALRG